MDRRFYREGIWFKGDPMWWTFDDAESVARGHNFWFTFKNGSAQDHVPFSDHTVWYDLTTGTPKTYTSLALDTRDSEWFLETFNSFNTKQILEKWTHADQMGKDEIRLMNAVYELTSLLMVQFPLFVCNIYKYGTPEMMAYILNALPVGTALPPTISTFLTTVCDYFDRIPMPWHMEWWKRMAVSRCACVGRSSSYTIDGLMVPITESICTLGWNWMTHGNDGTRQFRDPITWLIDEGLYSVYTEYFLPVRTGLDPAHVHIDDFVKPGAYAGMFQMWLNKNYDPVLVDPATYHATKDEYILDPLESITNVKATRFTTGSGRGYREKASSPVYDAYGGLNHLFVHTRPTDLDDPETYDVMKGQRFFVCSPEQFVGPQGQFNNAIENRALHEVTNWYDIGSGLSMDMPMISRYWHDVTGTWTPVISANDLVLWTMTCYKRGLSLELIDELFEDLMPDITNVVGVNHRGLKTRVMRHPHFFDTFPGSKMAIDPVCPVSGGNVYYPEKDSDLIDTIKFLTETYRFVDNPRKTGKIIHAI